MSKQVDERVVSMRFDNKQFESNVAQTMSTLDRLKQSLLFKGAEKGFQNVDSEAKKVDISHLEKGIEAVKLKFSALQVMGVTALTNITNSAINAGKRIASALTIDPIKSGFQEYETKMGAIQTIMSNTASKGTTMQDVTRVIGELNTYADKTIYNFAEMTRNIGTFTAAGVELETAASAIQGIANLAAASGSTSQQASTAMYQLSQAMAAGSVKLMDWNSVVNAGMGGQKFQDALKATAEEHGVAVDAMIKKHGSFRESLQEGWISADILNETLNKFTVDGAKKYAKSMMESGKWTQEQADALMKEAQSMEDAATKVKTFTQLWDTLKESAQSGWGQTWEIIVGDFEEAKEALTKISDVIGGMIGDSANKRNELLSGALLTGWKQLLNEGIDDAAGFQETVEKVAKEHGVKLEDMINDETSFQDTLKEGWLTGDMLTESVTRFTDKLSGMSAKELEAAGYTQETVDKMKALNEQMKKGEISMEEFANKMARPSGRELLIESLWNAFEGIMSVVKPIKEAFNEIFPTIAVDRLYSLIEGLRDFTAKLKLGETAANNIKRTFKGLFAIFSIGFQIIKAFGSVIMNVVKTIAPVGDGILGVTAGIGDFIVGIDEAMKSSNALGKIVAAIGKILKPIGDGIRIMGDTVKGTFADISTTAEKRFSPLTALANFIKSIFVGLGNAISKIAPWAFKFAGMIGDAFGGLFDKIRNAIQTSDYSGVLDVLHGGLFAAILVGIKKFIKSATDITDGAGGFLDNIKDILGGVGDALNAFTASVKAKTLKTIATAIAILAAALFVLSIIDSEKMGVALSAITTLFIELFAALNVFTKIAGKKNMGKVTLLTFAMINLASALLVLSVALKIMSTMSWNEMLVGLTALAGGLGALVTAVKFLPEKDLKQMAKTLKILAKSLVILAVAFKILGSMSWSEMGVGLISIVVGLGSLVAAVRLLPEKDVQQVAKTIRILSSSLVILAVAFKIFSTMSWGEFAVGLVAVATGLGMLIGVTWAMPKDVGVKAMGLISFATAMVIMAGALKIMGSMSWSEMGIGLITLSVAITAIVLAVRSMQQALAGAGAMLIVANALAILAPVLWMFGKMSLPEIGRGLLMISGIFVVFGIAAYALGGVTPIILALAGAVALFGVGCLAIGTGVLALSTGLTIIAVSGAAAGAALIAILSGLIGLIPYFIEQIGVGIVKFCEVIANSTTAICAAATTVILALAKALLVSIPVIVETVFVLVESILTSLVNHTPMIVEGIFNFLITLLQSIAKKLPDLIKAGIELVMAFFVGVIDALKEIDSGVLIKGLAGTAIIIAIMYALASLVAITPAAMAGVLAMGVLVTELILVLAALGGIAQIPGLQWLISKGGDLFQTIGTAIGQLIGGLIGGIAKGMASSLPDIGTYLSNFMKNTEPFLKGAQLINKNTLEGVKSLVEIILALTAANILDGISSWFTGKSSLPKFGEELAGFGPKLKEYADSVNGINPEAVKASAEAAKALAEMTDHIPNSGGVVSWFAGENSISKFASELPLLGEGLRGFSEQTAGLNPENITAAAQAAKALAEMTDHIPNSGGVVSWFTGDNSISKFGSELPALGEGLSGFSGSLGNVNPEKVIAAADAAKALAEMTGHIPNSAGMVSWFTGDNSISKFGKELPTLGKGLSGFSKELIGLNGDSIDEAVKAAEAIKLITSNIPDKYGAEVWFGSGQTSMVKYANDLPTLGKKLSEFAHSIDTGISADALTGAKVAAETINALTANVPDPIGLGKWLTGDNAIINFADSFDELGSGLNSFATSVAGITPEMVEGGATAARAIADISNVLVEDKGLAQLIQNGSNSAQLWANFKNSLSELGLGIKGFSDSAAGFDVTVSSSAATALKDIGSTVSALPSDMSSWICYINNLPLLGGALKKFYDQVKPLSENETAFSVIDTAVSKFEAFTSMDSTKISTVSTALDDLTNKFSAMGSISKDTTSGFVDAIENVAKISAETISTNVDSVKTTISNAGTSMVETFTTAITNKEADVKTVSGNIITAIQSTFDAAANEGKWTGLGKNVIDGIVKGLNNNKGLVSNKILEVVNAAVEAAKSKEGLDVNSPSKKFMAIGGSAVEGLIKGINTNMCDVSGSGVSIGDNLLNATKDYLKIHSPSVVFKNEVGRYVVQGIAEGIKSDMSAEEQAKKKAENIVNAFKEEFDKLSIENEIDELDFKLWSNREGKKATQDTIDTKALELLKKKQDRAWKNEQLAYSKWYQLKTTIGEDAKETREAWKVYRDEMVNLDAIKEEIANMHINGLNRDSDEISEALTIRENQYGLWEKTKGKYATDAQKDARKLTDIDADIKDLTNQLAIDNEAYEYAIANFAPDRDEVKNAYNKAFETESKLADKMLQKDELLLRAKDRELTAFDELMEDGDNAYQLWLTQNANNLSEEQQSVALLTRLKENGTILANKIAVAERQYAEAVAESGAESERAKELEDILYNAKKEQAENNNSILSLYESDEERQRDLHQLAADTVDLQYQLWEKTTGRKATSAEKNLAKVGMLSKQLTSQSAILQMAYDDWKEAETKYGVYSKEAQEKYKEYLNGQLTLANIQDEITTINEKNVARQKIAQSEYKNYIDKYEKYYSMNGMTRSELEKDAKLISGYDSNKTVNNIISNTANALTKLQDSTEYATLMTGFTSMGSSYVNAINEGVTAETQLVIKTVQSMSSACVTALEEEKMNWYDAAKNLVLGFLAGIKDHVHYVVAAASEMATSALNELNKVTDSHSPSREAAKIGKYVAQGFAQGIGDNAILSSDAISDMGTSAMDNLRSAFARIYDAVEDELDTQPVIRPVLDLSNVRSGTITLSNMLSRSHALDISTSRAESKLSTIQNGVASSKGGNTFQFTQNNYSPKALSRADIYRQTKNQFTALKGELS